MARKKKIKKFEDIRDEGDEDSEENEESEDSEEYKNENSGKRVGKGAIALLLVLTVILFLECSLFFVRATSEKQIDDITPGIPCDDALLEKADRLFVIPKYNGTEIGENDDWCEKILLMNKSLDMHGVYHTYNEFGTNRSKDYLDEGIIEFEKCFGEKPSGFKAPQLALNSENAKIIRNESMKIYGFWNQLFHKVYHCEDTGIFSNELIDVF